MDKTRNFNQDLKESNKPEILKQWEVVFKKAFGENILIEFKNDMISQKDFGSDVLITTKEGRKYSIDFKTKSYGLFTNYPNTWTFEITHHIYEKEFNYSDKKRPNKIESIPGWLYKSTSDYIFYGSLNQDKTKIIEVLGFSMIPFKNEDFKSEYNQFKNAWASTIFDSGYFQLTLNKVVPLDFIMKNSMKYWYWKN